MNEFLEALCRWEDYFNTDCKVILWTDESGHIEAGTKEVTVFSFRTADEFIHSDPRNHYPGREQIDAVLEEVRE